VKGGGETMDILNTNTNETQPENQDNLSLVDKTIEITSKLTNEIINTYKSQINTMVNEYLKLLDIVTKIIDSTGEDYKDLIDELRDNLLKSKENIQMLNSNVIETTVGETPETNDVVFIPSEDETLNSEEETNNNEEDINDEFFGEYEKLLKI
jgi:hypothetical protein